MAAKRIYQIVKEFERDEKEIIAFLTEQGIKVTNKLSAVSEETYNMLKAKFMAPPEPEPEPEPEPAPPPKVVEPAPVAESSEAQPQQPQPTQPAAKKKKKKNKSPQPAAAPQEQTQNQEQAEDEQEEEPVVSEDRMAGIDKRTRSALYQGIKAGSDFIRHYSTNTGELLPPTEKVSKKPPKPQLTWNLDSWALLYTHNFEYPDSSPARYWNAVAKLTTKAFKLNNSFGLKNRPILAHIREAVSPVGEPYKPREIFTEEENQTFAEQQKLLFETFGHGGGLLNDNLYELKLKAERMKVQYERMNLLEYVTNPQDEMRSNDRVPFSELVDAITYALRGISRRFHFFLDHEEIVVKVIKSFFEWIDGYAKLKEEGAPAEKLEKYLNLEKKFIDIVEFMSFDNLLFYKKNKPAPVNTLIDLLHDYRDNMDDPDAERNFKYKVRGVTNIIYKPKEYVFVYRFADLEPGKDYRPPEEIAAAEAAAKAAAEAEAKAAAENENPDDKTDEA